MQNVLSRFLILACLTGLFLTGFYFMTSVEAPLTGEEEALLQEEGGLPDEANSGEDIESEVHFFSALNLISEEDLDRVVSEHSKEAAWVFAGIKLAHSKEQSDRFYALLETEHGSSEFFLNEFLVRYQDHGAGSEKLEALQKLFPNNASLVVKIAANYAEKGLKDEALVQIRKFEQNVQPFQILPELSKAVRGMYEQAGHSKFPAEVALFFIQYDGLLLEDSLLVSYMNPMAASEKDSKESDDSSYLLGHLPKAEQKRLIDGYLDFLSKDGSLLHAILVNSVKLSVETVLLGKNFEETENLEMQLNCYEALRKSVPLVTKMDNENQAQFVRDRLEKGELHAMLRYLKNNEIPLPECEGLLK